MITRRMFLNRAGVLAGCGATQGLLGACGGGGGGADAAPDAPATSDQQFGGGLILQSADEQAKLPATYGAPVGAGGLPAALDLTTQGFFPPIGHQGTSQSCTAWAIGYAAGTYTLARRKKVQPSQPSEQISPRHVWSLVALEKAKAQQDCTTGYYLTSVLDLLKKQAAGFESDYPSANMDAFCPRPIQPGRGVLLQNSQQITDTSIQSIQSHLAHHGHPLPIGIRVAQSEFWAYRGGIYNKVPLNGEATFGHAMCIVGYDDTRRAWRIMNSYGTGWGEGGFMWFDYEAFARSGLMAGTIPEVHYITGVELSGESQPRTGSDLQFQALRAVSQVSQTTQADILYLSFQLSDWMQITHAAYSYHDGANQPFHSEWSPVSLYLKAGYMYFASAAGQRWLPGSYALRLYGTDRNGGTVNISSDWQVKG